MVIAVPPEIDLEMLVLKLTESLVSAQVGNILHQVIFDQVVFLHKIVQAVWLAQG